MLQKDHRLPSSCFALNIAQRSKVNTQACLLEILQKKLGEIWSEQSTKDKQPYEQKAVKLKEKYEKDTAAYRAKGKSEVGKKGPGRPTGSKKKNEEEEDEDEE
ncbi:High mobility group protein B2 [Lemmus lemmus]